MHGNFACAISSAIFSAMCAHDAVRKYNETEIASGLCSFGAKTTAKTYVHSYVRQYSQNAALNAMRACENGLIEG